MEQKFSYYKKQSINRFDLFDCKTNNAQDALKNRILNTYPIHYTDDVEDYEQVKQYKDQSEYVWLVDKSITVLKTFPWWFRPPKDSKETVFRFPYVYKTSRRVKDWHKVQLVSTSLTKVRVSSQRYICGVYDPYNGKDRFDIFFLQEKTSLARYNIAKQSFPDIVIVKSLEEAIEKTTTEMFWLVPDDVIINDGFEFDYEPDEWSYNYCHMFQNDNKKNYNGIVLVPKNYEPTKREVEYRHYASKKLVNIPASRPEKYDLFYIDTYEEFLEAQKKAESSMFWVVRSDLTIDKNFKFDYRVPKWDQKYVHVFLNGKFYDGVALFPTAKEITKREFENRYYTDQKEIAVQASLHVPYQVIKTDNYEDYLSALATSTTDMFWIVRSDFEIDKTFDLGMQLPHWEKKFIHVFLNDSSYDGLALFPKTHVVSAREFKNRLYLEKKECPIVASHTKKYDQFCIDTYDQYLEALETSSTELFWAIPSDVIVSSDFKFDLTFNFENEFDRNINHSFLNGDVHDGIFLFSKHKLISKKEFDHRSPLEKKEWDIVASKPAQYDIFEIDSYSDYEEAFKNSTTEMFWMVSERIKIADDFAFDLYFSHHDIVQRSLNHAFIHKVGGKDYYNGVFLLSKNVPVSRQEIEKRHLVEKKEWNIVASVQPSFPIYR